jgi:hypothetical protein
MQVGSGNREQRTHKHQEAKKKGFLKAAPVYWGMAISYQVNA